MIISYYKNLKNIVPRNTIIEFKLIQKNREYYKSWND